MMYPPTNLNGEKTMTKTPGYRFENDHILADDLDIAGVGYRRFIYEEKKRKGMNDVRSRIDDLATELAGIVRRMPVDPTLLSRTVGEIDRVISRMNDLTTELAVEERRTEPSGLERFQFHITDGDGRTVERWDVFGHTNLPLLSTVRGRILAYDAYDGSMNVNVLERKEGP